VSDDGGVLPCAINAATLALVNAGVPMKDMVVACEVGLVDDDVCVLDLNYREGRSGTVSSLTMGMYAESFKVAVMRSANKIPISLLEQVLALGAKGCEQVKSAMQAHLESAAQSSRADVPTNSNNSATTATGAMDIE
jgi:exosome complex component RRP41